MPDGPKKRLSILHLVLSIGETNTTYNEHCLPMAEHRDLTICTYFRSSIAPPATITLFQGNDSVRGFIQALGAALRARQYDVIHAHSPHVALLLLGAMLLGYSKLAARTVVTVHDSYADYKLRNRLLFLPVFAGFRSVVCCSRASYTSFPGLYKWLAGNRLGFVQNGVDIARIDRIMAAGNRKAPDGRFTVVAISRLVDVKNPFGAVGAFRMSGDHNSRLIYMGDGPLLKSLVEENRMADSDGRIEFTGLVPRDNVFEHLMNAELYISTSRGEGLPIAVMEAMACGCPVVLSDIPPHREIADGAPFIPLVAPDDVDGFAREIRKYHEMAPAERSAIGSQCRRIVEERFSLDSMHAGYEQIYRQKKRDDRLPLSLQEKTGT